VNRICSILIRAWLCAVGADHAYATSPSEALELLKSKDQLEGIKDRGTAAFVALARGIDAVQIARICSNGRREENDRIAEEGTELWKVNPSLNTCCWAFAGSYMGTSVTSAVKPYIELSLPEPAPKKMSDFRTVAAAYVAEKLLNLPLDRLKDSMETLESQGVTEPLRICGAAIDWENRNR
jgi:hypothetical protein